MKKKTFVILSAIVIILGIIGTVRVYKKAEEYEKYYPGADYAVCSFLREICNDYYEETVSSEVEH